METLRDKFAAAILPEVYRQFLADDHPFDEHWRHGIAVDAYAMANAMLDIRDARITKTPTKTTPQGFEMAGNPNAKASTMKPTAQNFFKVSTND